MNAASERDRICLSDPVGTIEQECGDSHFKQKDVALTYAMAIRDQDLVPVDWARANAAITKRWPKGLVRVKEAAWKILRTPRAKATGK
jgi:hypothetical protein